MVTVLEQAKSRDLPAVALEYESPACQLLKALCRQLQEEVGDAPFFLSTHHAAEMLGVPAMKVWRWRNCLCRDEVLVLVTKSNRRQASEYRCIGGD